MCNSIGSGVDACQHQSVTRAG